MPAWVRPFVAGLLVAAFIGGSALLLARPRHDAVEVLIATPAAGTITVAVSGEVARPGLYEMPPGSRVADLIQRAGGVTERADPATPSRALLLREEMHVHIPAATTAGAAPASAAPAAAAPAATPVLGPAVAVPATPAVSATAPAPPAGGESAGTPAPAGPVNLNTASAAELERLPGIGPALAGRIVADRERNGPFQRVEDLARVPGIGPAIVARVRPLVTV
jgi:competence protein ComEA